MAAGETSHRLAVVGFGMVNGVSALLIAFCIWALTADGGRPVDYFSGSVKNFWSSVIAGSLSSDLP